MNLKNKIKLKMFYTFGLDGLIGEGKAVPSRIGMQKEIEGIIFSVRGQEWIIQTPLRIKVTVPHFCPAEKGDLFYGIGTLVEEDPDLWKMDDPPMVKISFDDESVKVIIKKSFRCSKDRTEQIFFHLNQRARRDKILIQEYIDQAINCYLQVPSEEVLEKIFPKEKKENILRFFRSWSQSMFRRLELLGLTKDIIKEINKPPSEIYRLALENPMKIPELPMQNARDIMKRIGKKITQTDEKCASVLRYLQKELENGNLYIDYNYIQTQFSLSTEEFYRLEEFGVLAERETGRLFLREAYNINEEFSIYLYERLNGFCPKREIDLNTMNPKLTDKQKLALFMSLNFPLSIITGKGGSGKSTVIGEIYKQEPEVVLLSFTGKAVSRLSEITKSKDPSTIHKVIGNLEITEKVKHIIVDEATMAYTELVLKLFKSFPYPKYNYRITFVGDQNQLSPITWGAFFEQILESGKIPTVHLEQNLRVQVFEDDGIILNCNKLLEHVEENKKNKSVRPFKFTVTSNFQVRKGGVDDVISIITGRHNLGLPIDDIVILTPYKDGEGSVKEINPKCQAFFKKNKKFIRDSKGNDWYVGNPICNRVNNYYKNIMNGERGFVHDIDGGKVIVKIRDDFFTFSPNVKMNRFGKNYLYEGDLLDEEDFCNTGTLMLDYASTVHSAQGSEWDNVIIYIPKGRKGNFSGFVDPRLVYTMISRAKRKVWIVGDIDALCVAAVTPPRKKNDNFLELFLKQFTTKK